MWASSRLAEFGRQRLDLLLQLSDTLPKFLDTDAVNRCHSFFSTLRIE